MHAARHWQILCFALLVAHWSSQATAQEQTWNRLISAAKQEGKLVVLGSADPGLRKGLPETFKERFGVTVEYVGASANDAIGRLSKERLAGLYTTDVMFAGPTALVSLYSEKVLDPLRPLLLDEVLDGRHWKGGRPRFSNPEGRYGLRLAERVTALFMINKASVKREELRSIHDLTNPRWKRKIVAEDSTQGGAGTGLPMILSTSLGEEFVKKLYIDNEVILSSDRHQMADWLARGTYPISMGVREEDYQRLEAEGFSVEIINSLADFPGYVAVGAGHLVMINRAPHPNAARLFANWLVSKDGLQVYSRLLGEPTMRTDVDEAHVPQYMVPKPGVKYVDSASWEYALKRQAVSQRLRELLRKR
jgi:iron(III) transport system substrate-binding protein